MASKKLDVAVYDGDRLVAWLTARPVRLMPDGYAGVVYSGAVYPLHEGNYINVSDEPVDEDNCDRFLAAYSDIPYRREVIPDDPSDGGHLGIDDWYLESNQFGHYLVFDASENAARRLVDAVQSHGLGVRRWDKSSRPADNGQFYDWFIRLGFTGSRDECLRRVENLLGAEGFEQYDGAGEPPSEDVEFDPGSASLDVMVAMVLSGASEDLDTDQVVEFLKMLDLDGTGGHLGYFSWRYREAITRPSFAFDGSAQGRLQVLTAVVRDDKEMLGRLIRSHGRFLDEARAVSRRAIDAEFDRVDLDASWWSAEDALRRARASTTFLLHAVLLMFGDDECRDQLLEKVRQLAPPESKPWRNYPQHVIAAINNLDRVIGFVEQLLNENVDQFEERFVNGQDELLALERGEFDFIAELATAASGSAQTVDSELPFVVLPPGELIQSFIKELRAKGSYQGRDIDLRRIEVLKRLEDYLPEARCRIHRGAFPSSGRDNLYIVLSVARPDGQEDAVAISPCKGEHATFVVRHDCSSGLPWRVVLSRTKREAKSLGARKLLFTSKSERGIDEYEAMLEKLLWLLESEPEAFEWAGGPLNEEPQRYDTPLPLETFTAVEDDSSPGLGGKTVNWLRRISALRHRESR
jgi:hypothetical protein